ncbi:choline dehydrogenase [Zavarzinia sp. CC-PAN008]|uniref:choline dehydrogenase n=1 Tax=Zavarzinia sp. CC-PAN008 TaxID=3243332 RepID=UPI003F74A8EC
MAERNSFDYVIVGAGSAGCVLAARLSEDPTVRVAVLEAGGRDHWWDWRIHMPAALAYPMNGTRYNWDYHTEPQPNLGGRRMHWPRGRVLGGSSSINGMVYVRGNALDFDNWAQDPALRHWRYAECLPYFRKAETYDRGGDAYRGSDGPLHVQGGRGWSPLYQAFVEAGVAAGYHRTADMNGEAQEGFGRMDMTIHRGRRWSAARAYLHPAMKRRNLVVRTGALTGRVRVENGRAVGVEVRGGRGVEQIHAAREVILAGGAINSPQLLMLSGIGPADMLARAGVTPIHDLKGVGRNLQDHLELYVQASCLEPVSLYPATKWWRKGWVGARWLATQTGWGATNHFESGGFIRSRPGVAWPDIQYHFLPMAVRYDGKGAIEAHGFQVHVGPMRSPSRGTLTLRADTPDAHPLIDPNYMSHPDDWAEMRASIRLTREIFAQAPLRRFNGGEIAPGPAVQTDAELDAFIAQAAESAYHPCGTCRMGSGPDAVVDGDCRVHGIEGLRVVDASIMPQVTTGNLNAPVIMMAEKAADLIRGRTPLPPSDAAVWVADPATQRQA